MPTFGLTDVVYHGLVYIPLAVLVFRAVELSNPRLAIAGVVVYAAAICLAFAAFDELHQYPIPGRYAHIYDWYADAVGITIGLVPSALFAVRKRRALAHAELLDVGTSE